MGNQTFPRGCAPRESLITLWTSLGQFFPDNPFGLLTVCTTLLTLICVHDCVTFCDAQKLAIMQTVVCVLRLSACNGCVMSLKVCGKSMQLCHILLSIGFFLQLSFFTFRIDLGRCARDLRGRVFLDFVPLAVLLFYLGLPACDSL